MPDPTGRERLAAECDVFCRYLIGAGPSDAVTAAYCRAHEQADVEGARDASAFDRVLIRLARYSPLLTRAADAYASAFARTTVLRRKLVLLLAILEVSWPASQAIDSVPVTSPPGVMLRVGSRTVVFAMIALVATLLLTPVRMSCAMADRLTRGT